jgi:hypothetical protein
MPDPIEPTVDDIQREYPGFHVWQGVNYLWYASLERSSPPVTVRGEDLLDLRDELKRWVSNNEWYRATHPSDPCTLGPPWPERR